MSDAQRAEMRAEAVRLGEQLVEVERHLDALFASGAATDPAVDRMTAHAGARRGRIRAVHLRTHIAMRDALTARSSATTIAAPPPADPRARPPAGEQNRRGSRREGATMETLADRLDSPRTDAPGRTTCRTRAAGARPTPDTPLFPMPLRLSALLALVVLVGCQWGGRPDGAEANHSNKDGYSDDVMGTPLGTEAEVVEPLGGVATPGAAPVDLTQPPPTTGTADATSEVEEALTPGTER